MLAAVRWRPALEVLRRAVRERVAPWRASMELNVLSKADVVRLAGSCGLTLEAIGNINWEMFYSRNRFQLEPEIDELAAQPEFPLSHLYFFRRASSGLVP